MSDRDYRAEFMAKSQALGGDNRARLDAIEQAEVQEFQRKLDACTSPREKFILKNEWAASHDGKLPSQITDNTPLPRQDGEDPRAAFIRQTAEINGQKRADAATITCRRLRLDSMARIERHDMSMMTSQGFLVSDAYVTRAGIFNYTDEATGELRRELRPPEEVFKQESMDSLKMVPVTFMHPSEMVDVRNIKRYQVGTVGENIKRSGDFVACKLQVIDQAVIDGVKAGQISGELSCGYDADVIPESGTWNGQPYDAIQRNIRYNHVSIVPQGRAGADVRLILN